MTKKLLLRSTLLLFILSIILQHSTQTLAQAPAAPAAAPAPPGPTNVTKILEKAGQFSLLIRLMKATQVADQLFGQLNNSNNGMTIFAPTDNAFSSLKPGTLNQLTDEEKVELVQFHIVPTYLTSSQFQTVSNPLRTQAGDSGVGKFPLNVTTSGNAVNITTGVTNTSVSGTIYTDGQLAVYQVDQVLLPQEIFGVKTVAPAPAPSKLKKKPSTAGSGDSDDSPADNSSGAFAVSFGMLNVVFLGVVAIVTVYSL